MNTSTVYGVVLRGMSQSVSMNATRTRVQGIPNFYSKSMLGNTGGLEYAAQITVVWAMVAVILRIFSRRRMKTRIWWDDVCAIGAVFFLVTNQTVFPVVQYLEKSTFIVVGKEEEIEEKMRLAMIVVGLKLSLAFEVMYLISIFLVKFSMLFLYARFARHTKHITVYLRITQIVCGITFAVCILSLFLSCIPINKFWSLLRTDEKCTRRTLLTYTSGISNIVTNTLVLAVPVPLLFRANLTIRQRTGVSILYFFGAFVIVASALRFATQLIDVSVPQAMGWSQIEISLAIILACAPMCVKLLIAPLTDHQYIGESSQPVEAPTSITRRPVSEKSGNVLYESKFASSSPPVRQEQLTARQASSSVPGTQQAETETELRSRAEQLPLKYGKKNSDLSVETNLAVAKDTRNPGDISSPGYRRLKVVRAEVNGKSVWEVHPASPGTPVRGM